MDNNKKRYSPPGVIQSLQVTLERALLNSVVDFMNPIQISGHEVDNCFDYSTFDTNSFNHEWGE